MRDDESLTVLRDTWEHWGETDPLWAILSEPDKDGNRWDLGQFMATGEAEISAVFERLSQLGLAPPSRRALDFGCGVGRLSQALASRFARVDGVDISEAMLTTARRINRFGERCSYHHNIAPDLQSFARGTFSFLYSNITLQHMPPIYALGYVREFLRVLAPDGLAVFQIPSHFASPILRGRRWVSARSPALHRLYRALFHGDKAAPAPPYRMYSIARRRLEGAITRAGGQTCAVDRDHSAPPDWVSYRYFVRRREAASSSILRPQNESVPASPSDRGVEGT